VLIVSGANDEIFPGDSQKQYLGDLPRAEMHFAEHRPFRAGLQRARDCIPHAKLLIGLWQLAEMREVVPMPSPWKVRLRNHSDLSDYP
jgi:hypothetical protein